MIKPKKLQIGDTVGIIAPSFFVSKEVISPSVRFLEKLGFKVKLGQHIYERYGFMAGRDTDRMHDIHDMFEDKEVKAIFCAKGGSVCNRLLPLIDFKLIKRNPKIFMGMSDISVLLNAIHKKTNLITFHGANIYSGFQHHLKHNPTKEFNVDYMLKTLTKTKPIGKLNLNFKVMKEGKIEGELVGGNLEAVSNLNGTNFMPDYKDKIFFWEELEEDSSEISRILMNYKLAGVFNKIKGMVIGKLFKCSPYMKLEVNKIVRETLKEYNFPIIYNVDFGHFCENITLPIGIKAKIDTKHKSFEFLEPAVTE